jgi:hypothetical protein
MSTAQKRLAAVLVLALVTALGGRALVNDHRDRLAQDEVQSQQRRLFGCDAHGGAPTAVVLTSGATTTTLVRSSEPNDNAQSPTRWRLTTPIVSAADDDMVEAFVTAACQLQTLGPIRAKADEPPLDLQLFHLDHPRHELTLVWHEQATVSVAVGDISAFNNRLYVHRKDSPDVEQVDGAFNHHLERSLTSWRQKRPLVGMGAQDIQAVDVALSGAHGYRLARGPNETFAVTPQGGETLPADGAKAKEWLAALLDVRAEDFVAEHADPAVRKRFGLSTPKAVVQLTMADATTHTLHLGQLTLGDKTHTFAQVDGTNGPILRLATEELYAKLTDGAQSLEDMRVMRLDLAAVAKVVVTEGNQTVTYSRTEPTATEPATWHLGAPAPHGPDAALDQQKFVGALRRLTQMRAATIVTRHATAPDLHKAKLMTPMHTVALLTANDQPLEILWVGRKDGGQTLLTNDTKQIIYSVYEGTVEAFSTDIAPFLTAPREQDVAAAPKAQ